MVLEGPKCPCEHHLTNELHWELGYNIHLGSASSETTRERERERERENEEEREREREREREGDHAIAILIQAKFEITDVK